LTILRDRGIILTILNGSMKNLTKISAFLFLAFCGCVPKEIPFIEINSVPPPFDIDGRYPYVVWVNGERIDLPKKDIITLVNKIGKENIKKANPEDIHRGWLFSHLTGSSSHKPNANRER
jgi:hypothetical protein